MTLGSSTHKLMVTFLDNYSNKNCQRGAAKENMGVTGERNEASSVGGRAVEAIINIGWQAVFSHHNL